MANTRPNALTIDSLLNLPDDGRRYELVRGQLISEPRPKPLHGRIAATLPYLLLDYLDEHPIGEVLTCDPGFILARAPDTLRGPDVALVLTQRYPADAAERDWLEGAPDLAIEVLSPSDRPAALAAKVADYLGAGGTDVWLVDPATETVCVHSKGCVPLELSRDDILTAEAVLPGFRVEVARIFRTVSRR